MHSAITSAIGALKGPLLHGGANEAVFLILNQIDQEKADPVEYVSKMLTQKKKIPGFGHRVYHTEDPRATHAARHVARSRAFQRAATVVRHVGKNRAVRQGGKEAQRKC